MKFAFLLSMAMVGHITAQMEAPAPAPSAFMAPSSSVVATGPAPAPTPFDAPAPAPVQAPANMTNMTNITAQMEAPAPAPSAFMAPSSSVVATAPAPTPFDAPAPAPVQALANMTNMTNTPAPTWPDPPLVWPSNETSNHTTGTPPAVVELVGNNTADGPATVNVNMALTVEDPAGFVADPNSQGAVEAGIAAAIEGVEAADVNATLTVRTDRRLNSDAASGIVDVAAVITADDAAAAGDIRGRVQHGSAASAITTAINEAALAAGMNVTVEVTSLTASQPPASGGSTTASPGSGGESGAFKPAVVSKMVAGLVALFFAF